MNKPTDLMASDGCVSEQQDDEFGYQDYAKALSETVKQNQDAFCLGIFGGWGQGKTSLMRLIQENLQSKRNEYDQGEPVIIWFDAWKYDKEESVWRALLAQTLVDIEQALKTYKESLSDDDSDKSKQDKINKLVNKELGNLKEQLYRSFSRTETGSLTMDWSEFAKQAALAGIRHALPGGGVATGLFKNLKDLLSDNKSTDANQQDESSDQIEEEVKHAKDLFNIIKREQKQAYYQHIEYIEQFNTTFTNIVGAALDVLDSNQRLIFFIDDLDRCEPRKAIEVLEAIKLFLETPQTAFVIGIDDEVVQAGLKQRYGRELAQLYTSDNNANNNNQQRPYHMEYLEKIIQLPFTLPAIPKDKIKSYIEKRLILEGVDQETTHIINKLFRDTCQYNPRKIKRLCNLLKINWQIAQSRQKEEDKLIESKKFNPILLAKLVIIQTQHRELYYQLLNQQQTLLIRLERYFLWGEGKPEKDTMEKVEKLDEMHVVTSEDEAIETEINPAAREESITSDELTPYINIPWLKPLLVWTPDEKGIYRFGQLSKIQGSIDQHLELEPLKETITQTKSAQVQKQDLDKSILRDLLNEDTDIIASTVDRLLPEERKIYAEHLVDLLNSAKKENIDNWRQWVAAGDALGYLGDPRLAQPLWDRAETDYWITIPASEFYRGTQKGEEGHKGNNQDGKKHRIASFTMAKYPVTNKDWLDYIQQTNANPPKYWSGVSVPWGLENHPVVYITHAEASDYCQWLTSQSKGRYHYQLPTEAQWERVARGPANINQQENRRLYPWGDQFDQRKANTAETNLSRTTAVGAFPLGLSYEGIADLSGNVWEWCADKYSDEYYQKELVKKNEKGDSFVLRGGAFSFKSPHASCVFRFNYLASRSSTFDFRVVREKIDNS